MTTRPDDHLQRLRRAELELVRGFFRPGMRILEIGGGSGFQASLLASWGCDVTSLDVGTRTPTPTQYHDVRPYDGSHIPFGDATFDGVYSSNVLEHVRSLADLCLEMRRVLRPGGTVVHVVPSSTWRFWTSLAHYPYLVKRLFLRAPSPAGSRETGNSNTTAPRSLLARLLWAGPHGEYPSALAELGAFRRRRWLGLLRASGLEPIYAGGNRLFYTGCVLFPTAPLAVRRVTARLLGSSCHVFVMRARTLGKG